MWKCREFMLRVTRVLWRRFFVGFVSSDVNFVGKAFNSYRSRIEHNLKSLHPEKLQSGHKMLITTDKTSKCTSKHVPLSIRLHSWTLRLLSLKMKVDGSTQKVAWHKTMLYSKQSVLGNRTSSFVWLESFAKVANQRAKANRKAIDKWVLSRFGEVEKWKS